MLKGPYTRRFPFQPHTPAERFRGKPSFHPDDCMGCSACAQVCPSGAITFRDEVEAGVARRLLTVRWDLCVFCGQCQANCPTEKGIILSQEFDLATTGKRQELRQTIEKEFALCDCCREPVVPYDQLLWVARKLGPLIFSNASLMLAYLRSLTLAVRDDPLPGAQTDLLRHDRVRVLCPQCRRKAVLKS